MNDTTAPVVQVELFVWMKRITAKNNGKHYLMIGKVKDMQDTLLVTLEHGNGGAVMFCLKHEEVYPLKAKCSECQSAPREDTPGTLVTSCDSAENQR